MKDYFNIGKIIGSHGLSGEMVLQHALGKKTDLKGLQTIFVEDRKDSFLPYFVEGSTAKNNEEVYLRLEGFTTRESTRRLNQKNVWLLKPDFEKFAAKTSVISLLGYTMVEKEKEIGEIIEVIQQPLQVLCKVLYQGNEALIPLHEESLLKVDKKKKQVFVELPEGLLDIYSSNH